MQNKKVPIRKCLGCNEQKPKKELIRIVKAPDIKNEQGDIIENGAISLDLKGKKNGRGAYICCNINCLRNVRKSRRLERTFSCQIPENIYDNLERELSDE